MCLSMRVLLILLVGLLCVAAPGQSRHAALELVGGTKVSGPVLRVTTDSVVLQIDNAERRVARDQIRSCVFSEIPGLVANEDAPLSGRVGSVGDRDGAAGASPPRLRDGRGIRLWDQRMEAVDVRFPWLFPAEPLQWISLSVLLFALLSLGVHAGVRIVAMEPVAFGRATAIGLWLLISGLVQVAWVPGATPAVVGSLVANSLLSLYLFKVAYGLSLGAGFLAWLLLAGQAAVAYGALVLTDTMFRSIGNSSF